MFNFFKRQYNKFFAAMGFRSFAAAMTNRTNSDWVTSTLKTNEDLKAHLPKLKERSRELAKNNSEYRKYLDMRERNVIGDKGFKLQIKARNPNGQLDEVANRTIEVHWGRWGKRRNKWCSQDGESSFRDFCAQVDRIFAVDGEVFIRTIKGADNPYLFTLQIIDSMDVDIDKNWASPFDDGRHRVVMGVELDKKDRPVAYYVKKSSGDYYYANQYDIIPADEITHVFKKEFAGQVRGFPLGSAAIMDINMSQGYRESQLVAARVAACQMGVWEQTANNASKLLPDKKGTDDLAATVEASPGKFIKAPKGWSFKAFSPNHPGAQFSDFFKAIMRGIANGLGIAYNDFANDLEGVNFSSMRSGSQNERDGWKCYQRFFIENFLEVVFSKWLEMLLLSGLTNLPFSKKEKFDQPVFQGRRWPWIDPLKDAKANELAVKTLTKSPQEIIRENGGDPDDVLAEINEFETKARSLGLTLFPEKTEAMQNGTATQN